MGDYFVPGPFGQAEFVEKRSRFIGRVWRAENEEQALCFIKETQKQHWDATHNVYAYIIKDGPTRFSDDGEPGGTAGLPVLDVFRKGGIYNVCCVVTRYFGGILLGGGGLVRAYSHSAKIALDAAQLYVMKRLAMVEMLCPYNMFERVKALVETRGGQCEDISYGAQVLICASLPVEAAEVFARELADCTNGTVAAISTGEQIRAARLQG